jgi:hypothetical protein
VACAGGPIQTPDGLWHVFPINGNWGHCTARDLLHWNCSHPSTGWNLSNTGAVSVVGSRYFAFQVTFAASRFCIGFLVWGPGLLAVVWRFNCTTVVTRHRISLPCTRRRITTTFPWQFRRIPVWIAGTTTSRHVEPTLVTAQGPTALSCHVDSTRAAWLAIQRCRFQGQKVCQTLAAHSGKCDDEKLLGQAAADTEWVSCQAPFWLVFACRCPWSTQRGGRHTLVPGHERGHDPSQRGGLSIHGEHCCEWHEYRTTDGVRASSVLVFSAVCVRGLHIDVC